MNVLTTQFSLETRSLDIYLAGCKGPHCENCHNPESWDFNQGVDWKESLLQINDKVARFPDLIENIMIFGGEPFDQDHEELETFLWYLDRHCLDIWLFTRLKPLEVPEFAKRYLAYLKCGRYEENLRGEKEQYGIKLASTNQHIFKKGVDF